MMKDYRSSAQGGYPSRPAYSGAQGVSGKAQFSGDFSVGPGVLITAVLASLGLGALAAWGGSKMINATSAHRDYDVYGGLSPDDTMQ